MSDLDKSSRELIRAARSEFEPTADEQARLEQVHAAILGGASPTVSIDGIAESAKASLAGDPALHGAAAGIGTAGKILIAGLLVGAGLVAAFALWPSSKPASETRRTMPVVTLRTPDVPPAIAPTVVNTPPVPVLPSPVVDAPLPASAQPPASPRRNAVPTPHEETVSPAEAPAAQVVVPTESDSLREQARLIASARRQLAGGDARGAIDLLNQFRTGYPNAALHQEEQATRVLTLCALGRRDDAVAEANEFRRDFPSSPFLARVEASCASSTTH